MSYCSVKDTLKYVTGMQGAIVACNVHNLEFVQGTVRAAEELRTPIILMLSEPTLRYADFEQIVRICLLEAERAIIPVAIALDHGKDDAIIKKCISRSLSVMFDGSDLSLDENISRTQEYVALAHSAGVSFEGEVGALGSEYMNEKEQEQEYTSVEQAARYATSCDIDALAISIGNIHGIYTRPPVFDVERLKAISSVVTCPIVLHGGSNVPDEQIIIARNNGVKKCNFGTDLRYAFFSTLEREIQQDTTQFKPFGILGAARDSVREQVKAKIHICGSAGIC